MSGGGDGAPLTRVESYQWPSGHVGHLSDGQKTALEKFQKLCEEKGYYEAGTDSTPPSHDDETLLRYLRARKFVPEEAFKQLKDTEDWRKDNQLDKLYETIDINEYEASRRLYPQWIGRRDKRGIPFYVYEISDLDPKAVTAYTTSKDKRNQSTNTKTPWKMLKLFALYENLCRFVLPMCSALPDRAHQESPISQSNNIVDMTGVSLSKLFNLRNHMSDASKLATAHYPETLDRIFVVGAPSYFPTVWGWIKNWFDPITVSKIFILSKSDMTSTLKQYVDEENFPKKYGGKLDWKFGDMPNLEPALADAMTWHEDIRQNGNRTLPIGPIRWEYNEKGDMQMMAVGSENGTPRQRRVAELPAQDGVTRLALSAGKIHSQQLAGGSSVSGKSASGTTTGTATPAEKDPAVASNGAVENKKPTTDSTDPDLSIGKDSRASIPDSSRVGTYTIPYKDTTTGAESSMPPSDTRQGTSSTRYEQQASTHAAGQLAEGTPDIKVDSQGERQGIMEPNTVGQAPKEHPMPGKEEPAQPGVVEQAQNIAGQAVEQAKQVPATVMGAVGMGGKTEEKEEEKVQEKKEDPEVDGMEGTKVEEFLRAKTMSQPEMGK